ncbi:DUF6036 family nucleotidyltransferase [Bacillus sp. Marseille-P3661]|uniref:DUF6036 family nucleotidyltransferase n=1 Tax=Bacillus sp. Marseille-P3661 TaxID=1936234 RepID=UPI000C867BFE|nr:DUF6036 family nucleotidyltransferase [Bacillus sp. Marseille-P3661]
MSLIEKAKEQLQQLQSRNQFEKMLKVTAILTYLLEERRLRPIVVGGLAVEIYTRSDYTTTDIDLILSDREVANALLLELGFTKVGRHWYHEDLSVSIEIPNDILRDADEERVIELSLEKDLKVYVIAIEDIILNRLRACVHWKSSSDCEWGKRMLLLHRERLDIPYMFKQAKVDLTINILNEWIK